MWKERPISLTPIAYQWCSAISEVAGQIGLDVTRTTRPYEADHVLSDGLPQVGSNSGPPHLDNASHIRDRLRGPASGEYLDFRTPLEVAFRLVGSANDVVYPVRLNRTSHPDRVFEAAFSSDDDEVIADAACAWITWDSRPTGSCARYFSKRVGNLRPFLPRLRRVAIHAIERSGSTELTASGLEVVRLLDRLDAGVGDLDYGGAWQKLLVDVIRSPVGENLSSHYWRLLGELESTEVCLRGVSFETRDVGMMRSFEEAQDWEKLEVWMMVGWKTLHVWPELTPELLKDIKDVTLKLLLSRPPALQSFERLLAGVLPVGTGARLVEVLDKARAGRLPSELQHLPYVSIHPSLFLSVLTLPFLPSSQLVLAESLVPLPFARDGAL